MRLHVGLIEPHIFLFLQHSESMVDGWVNEFAEEKNRHRWADEFADGHQESESMVDKWATEFQQRKDKDQVLESDIDFWDKLQRQWDELAR